MADVRFYSIKDEVRILGIDDAHFTPGKKGNTMIVGVVFRGGSYMDGVLRSEVTVDGTDSTDKVVGMVNGCKFRDVRVIMLDGLGFAGFNLVDIERLYNETKIPVIVVVRRMPDFKAIRDAINGLRHRDYYLACMEKAGEPRPVETKPGRRIYIQHRGISFEDAREIVRLSSTRSLIPEPIRVAHLIASGIALGESRGGA
ncbi:MAG: DUF99 family protein [Candidatus Altiarchaeota archaeon]|nr:DUF99 family protein [Candidatus Altiarchaeota archaeon]